MKHILCYGDSNTWGCVPERERPVTPKRYAPGVRWPGVMRQELGEGYHIYENALNGRTTVFEDPIEEGRCGKAGFPTALEVAMPLDLVIFMLGTNDTKPRFNLKAIDIGWGMELLVQYVKRSGCGEGGACPRILITAPAPLTSNWEGCWLEWVFDSSSTRRSQELASHYRRVADLEGVDFFDAAPFGELGIDGVHFTPAAHAKLGKAMAEQVRGLIG
ncbi:MAG: SGNH/GDSL hydrolase family protein [Planctomycetota bacterium]|jgi:lysophospholipase L1-like esterase|nr:SGNH/GDSL hydrolase family protein [Planctomycetota bacterium]